MDTQVKRGNYFLAAVLAGDAAMSIKPPKFIRDCLNGVNFPQNWWWSLIVIKSLAALGLVRGTAKNSPQMTTATSTAVGVMNAQGDIAVRRGVDLVVCPFRGGIGGGNT